MNVFEKAGLMKTRWNIISLLLNLYFTFLIHWSFNRGLIISFDLNFISNTNLEYEFL